VGWCMFEGINHIQIVYLFGGYLLREIGSDSMFPIVGNLIKMNEVAPSLLYLTIFQVMCFLMALQLTIFQFGNIGVNLTTNERMNAFRYSYLIEHQQNGLKGNPYDKGGLKKNLLSLLSRGAFTKLPKFDYKSLDLDIEKVAGNSLAEIMDIHDAGAPFSLGQGVSDLNRSAVHKFVTQLFKTNLDVNEEDLRHLLLHVLRRLCSFSEYKQGVLLAKMSKRLPIGDEIRLDQLLLEVVEEADSSAELTDSKLDEIAAAAEGQSKEMMDKREQAEKKSNAVYDMMEYMIQNRRLAAMQVMTPEQLVVFLEDHAMMEGLESLPEKQKVLAGSQRKMQSLVHSDQQKEMAAIMKVKMLEWKNAGAQGLPAVSGLNRLIPDEVAEFLMKQQYIVAQQVMNQEQFSIFKEGWTKVLESASIEAKQLAFKESQTRLAPMMSAIQKEETRKFLQLKLVEYNKENQTAYWINSTSQ